MKTVCLLSLTLCAAAFAQSDTVVRWRGIEGVITAPGVDNPVGQIHSGAGPWTTRGGSARIDVTTGEGSFDVEGLVFNGGATSGSTGTVKSVVGTFVCNPGNNGGAETVVDTPAVDFSADGNAELSFKIALPATCNAPVFLIRIPSAGRWIATGTKPATGSKSRY